MLIKCPFCHAEARLSESQEGAKVRCGECEKVYTARQKGVRGKQQDANTTTRIAIGAGAVVILGVVFALVRGDGSKDAQPVVAAVSTTPAPEAPAPKPAGPWDSEPVLAVRDVYAAVAAYDDTRALGWFDLERAHDARVAEGEALFSALSTAEAAAFKELLRGELTERSTPDALSAWKPFDGEVVHEDGGAALVHVRVSGVAGETALETRTIAWSLVRSSAGGSSRGAPWRVVSWERFLTEDELAALNKRPQAEVKYVQLTDGSTVFEAAPEPLEHLASTSPELRIRIDRLCVQLIDLELAPKQNATAKAELVEIGGPALPSLLTTLFGIELLTQDEAIQINLINQCLEEITGHYTGYKPQLMVGSATGTSAERRESAVKQWFAWWHRKGAKFLAAPGDGDAEGSADAESSSD